MIKTMPKGLPVFENLDINYPLSDDPQRVIHDINPAFCDNKDFANTCTMRISQALNACPGHEIPKLDSLYTIKGVDGKRYAVRVKEMKQYLTSRYGNPQILNASKGVIDKSSIIGKKGIIAFDVEGWDDASGHFTLWDGEHLAYTSGHDYFNFYYDEGNGNLERVTKASFWKCQA
ncbi:MAG: hypothetical protein JWQ09_1434 [Segetibacter sp.]|nr:hypothetical protein [Segetibacter sp.]